MGQKDGYIAGYRDEVRQAIETLGPGGRWRKGYDEGRAQARKDLEFREEFLRGLEELNGSPEVNQGTEAA